MPTVIVHAGFHKTGTTTTQQTLRINREKLSPYCRVILRPGMKALCKAARAFSVTRSDLDLALVKFEAAELAQRLRAPKPVILCSEDLSGHMPGHHDLRAYSAAPVLVATIQQAFRAVLPRAVITWFFSTRRSKPWINSCYGQHLRSSRITLGPVEYLRRFRGSADLKLLTETISAKIPDAKVAQIALEKTPARLGPAHSLLKLANVPDAVVDSLTTIEPANPAPSPELADALLALNRSDLNDADLLVAKRTLLSGAAT